MIIRHKKIPPRTITIALGAIVLLLLIIFFSRQHEPINLWIDNVEQMYLTLDVPIKYADALTITSFDHDLQVKPLATKSSRVEQIDSRTIRYKNAYNATDVEQVLFANHLKESIILKSKNHPDSFAYEINLEDYLWEIADNGDILLKQKEPLKRFEINEEQAGLITATINTDYQDGTRVLFRIPAPFLVEQQNLNRVNDPQTDKGKVKVEINNNELVLTPDKDWLRTHTYPIVLDPTVEVIPPEAEKIELGSGLKENPAPKMKLYKWQDEAFVSLEYITDEQGEMKAEGEKIVWTGDKETVEIYAREPQLVTSTDDSGDVHGFTINERGGVEMDVILEQRPKSNIFNFKIEDKDLEFHYQPALHPDHPTWADEDNDGEADTFRPEEVVGSYVAYHKYLRDDYTQLGGKNYRAGIAFHIYRPKIYDAAGDWVWGALQMKEDNSILSVEVDENWLAKAVYPVRIDPNFGYETAGGSSSSQVYIEAYAASPIHNGTATSISAYLSNSDARNAYTYEYALYRGDTGAFLHDTAQGTISAGASAGWLSQNYTSNPNATSTITFYIGSWIANKKAYRYYNTVTDAGRHCTSGTYATWPTTCTFTTVDNAYSIYTTYTIETNQTPAVSAVTDEPATVNVGSDVTFSVNWSDGNVDESIKVKICKTDSLTNQNCGGGYWATSTVFSRTDPKTETYTTSVGDLGTNNYYAFVCDDQGLCSSTTGSSSGSFVVVTPPSISSVSATPGTVAIGNDVTFSVNWGDASSVKLKICKTDSLTNQNCDGGYWATSTDFTTDDPEEIIYTTAAADVGLNKYFVFACNNVGSCSDSTSGTFTVTAAWWNTSWANRKLVTFDNLNQTDPHTNFPALATSTSADTDFWTHVKDDAGDVRVISEDGQELYFELERWNATTDNMVMWIKIPYAHATTTENVWLYYGNAAATATTYATTTGVWTNNFNGVWHFGETTGDYQDSGSYNNDALSANIVVSSRTIEGPFGSYCPDFIKANNTDGVMIADNADGSLDPGSTITVGMWVQRDSTDTSIEAWYVKQNGAYMGRPSGTYETSNYFHDHPYIGGTAYDHVSTATTDDTNWHYWTWSYSDANDLISFYKDGQPAGTASETHGTISNSADSLWFGNYYDYAARYFGGSIDEARLSNAVRSDDWIAFEYCNMAGSCNIYSAEEDYSAGSNNQPTISTATDAPDTIGVGSRLIFSVDWADSDSGDNHIAVICKGSGIATSTQACKDGEWARGVWTNRDPDSMIWYTTLAEDKDNTRNYWAFACDDSGDADFGCSNGEPGSFTVTNQRPDAPSPILAQGQEWQAVNIDDATPIFAGYYLDTLDEGDVAVKYCVEVDTQSDFAGTQMWVTDSANCYTGTSIGSNVGQGTLSPAFTYDGTALSLDGTKYYWRMWFWDGEERSATSSVGWFQMADASSGGGVRLEGGRLKGGVRLK